MSFAKLRTVTKLLTALSPFICLAGIVILQGQEYKKSIRKLNSADYLAQEQEQARLINWQKQSAYFGFDNLQADLSYLNFVQYFGDKSARETIGYKLVPDYFSTVSSIDPRFTQAHLRLAIANSMYAGNPEQTIAFMEQILQSVDPKSAQAAYLWTSKGLDELLFMGDKQAAIGSYNMAANWADLTKGDRADKIKIKDLESALESTDEIDLKEAQIFAWSSVLVNIKDYQRKQEIIDKISNLKAEVLALKQTEIDAN
jgi:hypothetical protein